jgi:peptide deformylase
MILADDELPLIPSELVSHDEVEDLINKLESELLSSSVPGIGLAACQIGIFKQAFIIRISELHSYNFINPKIISLSDPVIYKSEGCLSYPGVTIRSLRYYNVTISDDLNPTNVSLSGLPAIAAQHEYQHILGHNMFKNSLTNITDSQVCLCESGLTFAKCCKIKIRKNIRII